MILWESFAKGLYSNVINKLVESNLLPHVSVNMIEKYNSTSRSIVRDKDAMIKKIWDSMPNVKNVKEYLYTRVFAIGNGQGSILGLTGISETSVDMISDMDLLSGDLLKFKEGSIENPLILDLNRAEDLNVKVGDIVRVRFNTIYGQIQTAQLNLVAIVEFKNPLMSLFMRGSLPINLFKELMGYQQYETQGLNIELERHKKSNETIAFADQLHKELIPEPAIIEGTFRSKGKSCHGAMTGIQSDKVSIDIYQRNIHLLDGNIDTMKQEKGEIHISKSMAEVLDLAPGSYIIFSYQPKYKKENVELNLKIAAIIDYPDVGIPRLAFMDAKSFYGTYFNNLPEDHTGKICKILSSIENPLVPAFTRSWKRAQRTYKELEYEKKLRDIRRRSFNGSILDVVSMQEYFEDLFRVEYVGNILGRCMNLIVLSIIIVGISNTMRMNIRERIREIGTIRAVGMQQTMVIQTLVTEVCLLCFFSALLGIFIAYGLMELSPFITFNVSDINLSILLKDGHPVFKAPLVRVVGNIMLALLLIITAGWIPARKAAKKPVAESLGHYE
jgi:ABC-type lipoprotein release transport system permease subunit